MEVSQSSENSKDLQEANETDLWLLKFSIPP